MPITIPTQLNEFRFIKTKRKIAIESGYPLEETRFEKQSDNSYKDLLNGTLYKSKGAIYKGDISSYTYEEMQLILNNPLYRENDISYGVLGGYNGLVVVDLDNKDIAQKLMDVWPFSDTFSVLSGGKRLPHFYFKCQDYSRVVRYDGKNDKRLLDIQGKSTYVIGPNSCFMSNNIPRKYQVNNKNPIIEIDYEQLITIIEETIGDNVRIQKKERNDFTNKFFIIDPISSEIFKKIDCDTILDEANIDIAHNPGDTPFANSDGKKCLHRSNYLWFDHHTQQGGTVIQLYAQIYNVDSLKAKYDLAERVGVTDEIFQQAIQYQIANQQHEMTELITIKFMSSTPTYTIRSDKTKTPEIYVYKDGIYIPHGISYIQEFCNNILGKWYTTGVAKKIVDKITVRTLIDAREFFKEANSKYIPVMNGILNIENKKLYEFSPEFRFFNKLPVLFNEEAMCPTTINHFKLVLNGDNDVIVMQELYGSLLFREYIWQKAFMFYGGGGNGKSKTIEQMKSLLGQENTVNLSLQQLQNEKFLRCQLHGKLANLADDIGNAKLEETQIFKELTGESTITADRKFMDVLTFKSYAKMIFSANKLPDTVDDTGAFWRRWKLLGFTKKFISQIEYNKLLNENNLKPYHRVKDPEIGKKLQDPEELSGVLNWALEGYSRLRNQKDFSYPDSEEEVKNIWKRRVSPAVAFIQDCLEKTFAREDYETNEKIENAFGEYCQRNQVIPEGEKILHKFMREANIISIRKSVSHGKERRWLGIRIKEEYK